MKLGLTSQQLKKKGGVYLMRTTDVLSRSSLGLNSTGILTTARGLRIVNNVPDA